MAAPPSPPPKRRGRFWLNVGEAAAVIAVLIAGLNYWDSRRDRGQAAHEAAKAAQAHAAIVLRGEAEAGGRRIMLAAVSPGQVIQSQRYYFPRAVLDHAMEVSAARPQIDLAWIEGGLGHALEVAHAKGDGEAGVPVAIVTTFVEDGDTRTDRSLYRIGYAWRGRLLLGRRLVLQGIALEHRGVSGDLAALADRHWTAPQGSGAGPT